MFSNWKGAEHNAVSICSVSQGSLASCFYAPCAAILSLEQFSRYLARVGQSSWKQADRENLVQFKQFSLWWCHHNYPEVFLGYSSRICWSNHLQIVGRNVRGHNPMLLDASLTTEPTPLSISLCAKKKPLSLCWECVALKTITIVLLEFKIWVWKVMTS